MQPLLNKAYNGSGENTTFNRLGLNAKPQDHWFIGRQGMVHFMGCQANEDARNPVPIIYQLTLITPAESYEFSSNLRVLRVSAQPRLGSTVLVPNDRYLGTRRDIYLLWVCLIATLNTAPVPDLHQVLEC